MSGCKRNELNRKFRTLRNMEDCYFDGSHNIVLVMKSKGL